MQTPYTLNLADIPLNRYGRITRLGVLDYFRASGCTEVYDWYRNKLPAFTTYCGSSLGNDPLYAEQAEEYSYKVEKVDGIIVNGGGAFGNMLNVTKHCSRVLSFTPYLFAMNTGSGAAEGLNPHAAINAIVRDFYERKVLLDLFGDVAVVLAGGYGSLDEGFEANIFAPKHGKHVYYVSPNGYWDQTKKFFASLQNKGLFPQAYARALTFVPTAHEAVALGAAFAHEQKQNTQTKPITVKPESSLCQYLLPENNEKLQQTILDFIKNWYKTEDAPRIGLVASGNIGMKDCAFNLEDAGKRAEICANAAVIGKDMAKQGGVLVIAGSNAGLRQIVAQECVKNGGQVIWVRKGDTKDIPLRIDTKSAQIMSLTVPRHYDLDRMMGMLSNGYVGISGGIHTADRILGIVTRNQTGHGTFEATKPWTQDNTAPRPVFYLYDPKLGNGEGLWQPLREQFMHCVEQGFIKDRDVALLDFRNDVRGMVASAIESSKRHPDLLKAPCYPTDNMTVFQKRIADMVGIANGPEIAGAPNRGSQAPAPIM